MTACAVIDVNSMFPFVRSSLKAKQFTFVHVPATTSMGRMNATEKRWNEHTERSSQNALTRTFRTWCLVTIKWLGKKEEDRKRRRHNIDFNNNNSRSSFSTSLFPFIFTRIHNFLFIFFLPFLHSFCSVTLSSIHVVLSQAAFSFSLRAFLFLVFFSVRENCLQTNSP